MVKQLDKAALRRIYFETHLADDMMLNMFESSRDIMFGQRLQRFSGTPKNRLKRSIRVQY